MLLRTGFPGDCDTHFCLAVYKREKWNKPVFSPMCTQEWHPPHCTMSPHKTTVKAAGRKNHKRLDHIPPHVRAQFFCLSVLNLSGIFSCFDTDSNRYDVLGMVAWSLSLRRLHIYVYFCQIVGVIPLQMGQISRILRSLGRLRMEKKHPVQSRPRSFLSIPGFLLLGWQSRCTLVGGRHILLAFVTILGDIPAKGPEWIWVPKRATSLTPVIWPR
jgi:hypothetical protein